MFKALGLFLIIISLSVLPKTTISQVRSNSAPDFSLTDTYGGTVNLYDTLAEGKTVLLFFFSCDCVHCYNMAPIADSISRRFGSGSENLTVWGIAQYNFNNEEIEAFIDSTDITFRCFGTGHETDVFTLYDISYTPQLLMVCDYLASESIPQDVIVETLEYCFPTEINNENKNLTTINIADKIIHINSDKKIELLQVFDITGRELLKAPYPQELTNFDNSTAGHLYIISNTFEDGSKVNSKISAQ